MAVAIGAAGCVRMGEKAVPGQCGAEWWSRVYSPRRFVIQQPCVTLRATVDAVRHPLDGDAILIVTLDPEYAYLSNEKNREHYGKDSLELEIVCKNPISRFFVLRCWRCVNKIPVPKVGDRIEADGFYVLDIRHQHMELHPVTRLEILSPAGASSPRSPRE